MRVLLIVVVVAGLVSVTKTPSLSASARVAAETALPVPLLRHHAGAHGQERRR